MAGGFGGCCCGCTIDTLSSSYLVRTSDLTDAMHSVRLGVVGGNTVDCVDLTSYYNGGFLLFYQGSDSYTRTGRTDSVEIDMLAHSTPYKTDGNYSFYCPSYIHITQGSFYLNFDYGESVDLDSEYQTLTITTNCPGTCDWSCSMGSWVSHRYILTADLPSQVQITVAGMADSGVPDACCDDLQNVTWTLDLTSSSTFDEYAEQAYYYYVEPLFGLSYAHWLFNHLPTYAVCQLTFGVPEYLVNWSTTSCSGYFLEGVVACAYTKDPFDSTWWTADNSDVIFNGCNGFGCVSTGYTASFAEV